MTDKVHWKIGTVRILPDWEELVQHADTLSLEDQLSLYLSYLEEFNINVAEIDKDIPMEVELIEDWNFGKKCEAKINSIQQKLGHNITDKSEKFTEIIEYLKDLSSHIQPNIISQNNDYPSNSNSSDGEREIFPILEKDRKNYSISNQLSLDEEKLKSCIVFNPPKSKHSNRGIEDFITDMKTHCPRYNLKMYSALALLLYESSWIKSHIRNKPFSKWLIEFSEICHLSSKPTYHKNHIKKEIEELRRGIFFYIP